MKKILEIELSANNTFDDLAILSLRITGKDEIEKLYSLQPKGKNIIFNKPFPVIRVVSKRTLLNKTSNFIPKLIKFYRKKFIKTISKFNVKFKKNTTELKRNLGDNISINSFHRRIKTCINN